MDKLTRKDLKTDKFAQEVTHSVDYVAHHRAQTLRYGGIGLAVIALVVGGYYFRKSQHEARQSLLADALRDKSASVAPSPQPGDPRKTFPTQAAKEAEIQKSFDLVVSKYPSSDEASVAHYQLGSLAADKGKLDEAEKHFKAGIEAGGKDYASVNKLSLLQVYQAQRKYAEAEKLCRDLMNNPTVLVSKEQATFALARVLAATNAQEARKLLAPYEKDERPTVARTASSVLSELPIK